ncbi:hypothetical protein N7478_007563 [Penicillium angulare]|uniref:uncharacterized protein n=1 Tax=Penicillium angulare TaxID=116970 RepID=UPI00254041A0|nr:uncharacterized protein N7478_007563 [Penicillium angulare]KAJ5272438.1 hypothetical protein N7478_007563 [Penicillium angulare]
MSLPATYLALVCREYGQPLALETRPTPAAVPGSAVIKVLSALVDPSEKSRLLMNKRNIHFSQQPPFVPGNCAVGRVAAVANDATTLRVGQLVLLECFVRGRDDPNAQALRAVFEGPSPSAKRLTHQEDLWRDGHWAEYTRAPLETCWPLDEKALLGRVEEGGLGYKMSDIPYLAKHAIAYGAFRTIDLKAGETIVIGPATGNHGGAAVQVASAMGARTIAVSRNVDALRKLRESIPRVETVALTGNPGEDVKLLSQFGPIDAFLDFTPAGIQTPPYLKAFALSLKPYGRGVLAGFPHGDVSLPYGLMVGKNITIRGSLMYQPEDVRGLIKLAERGLLKLGKSSGSEVFGGYTLDQHDEAITKAHEHQVWGTQVSFELEE